MVCSLPGSSVHGILQARILEWVAISFSNIGCYWLLISSQEYKVSCGLWDSPAPQISILESNPQRCWYLYVGTFGGDEVMRVEPASVGLMLL